MVRTDSADRPHSGSRKPASGQQHGKRTSQHRVKTTSTKIRHHRQSATYLNAHHYDLPRSTFPTSDVDTKELVGGNLYDVIPDRRCSGAEDDVYVNMNNIYENITETSRNALDIYDLPRPTQPIPSEDDYPTYRNVKSSVKKTKKSGGQKKLKTRQIYDIPRTTGAPIYDAPPNDLNLNVLAGNEYDCPKNLQSLIGEPLRANPPVEDPSGGRKLVESGLMKIAESQSTSSVDEGIAELDINIKGLDLNQDSEEAISANEINRGNDYVNLAWSSSGEFADKTNAAAAAGQCQAAHSPREKSTRDSSTTGKGEKESTSSAKKSAAQRDRSIDVYNETLRQRTNTKSKISVKDVAVFQVISAREDMDKLSTIRRMRKLLPSVKALRNQFESRSESRNSKTSLIPTRKWKSSFAFHNNTSDMERSSRSHSSSLGSLDDVSSKSSSMRSKKNSDWSALPEGDTYRPRPSTSQWDPTVLLNELYGIPEAGIEAKSQERTACINLEGYLEKLPSGRRKATFWNAWKKRFFKLDNGYLYCYHHNGSENAAVVMELPGGTVKNMDDAMICLEDAKGRHMVIRGGSSEETQRWYRALETHVPYPPMCSVIVPCPVPRDPSLFKDTVVIDIGSCSIRAGILSSQPTLPQVFFPSVGALDKSTGAYTAFGVEALHPEIRSKSKLVCPLRLSSKVSKMAIDFAGLSGLIRSAFQQLNVIPSDYRVQVSVPRRLNPTSQNELVRLLFNEFHVKSVHLAHQAVLSLLSYNDTSGIVVDIGDRIDIVPIKDGYILEAGVCQVPYGGPQLTDHMRHYLVERKCSLLTEVESYLVRYAVEKFAHVAKPDRSAYSKDVAKYRSDTGSPTATLELSKFGDLPWQSVSLSAGRSQVAEGLFRPEIWGLDNDSVPKLVLRAIQECAVDVRKEISQGIYLSGGVTLLKGFPERLQAELDHHQSRSSPKVNASPYRYHAAYIGACVQANSADYEESTLTRLEWETKGQDGNLQWKL